MFKVAWLYQRSMAQKDSGGSDKLAAATNQAFRKRFVSKTKSSWYWYHEP